MNSINVEAQNDNGRNGLPKLPVADMVALAFDKRNLLATILGFVFGGAVPASTFLVAHYDIADGLAKGIPLYLQVHTLLVLGGLIVSAKTVYAWTNMVFQDGLKAAGAVVLLEGVMLASNVPGLPVAILALLVGINGVACGCTLSLARAKARAEAKAQRAESKEKAPKRAPKSRTRRRTSGIELKTAA